MSGLSGTIEVNALTGDASWGGYTTVSGRWIVEPGEAVVPTPFLAATGTRVGDTVTLSGLAEPVTVRIVGEVLDTRNDGMQVFTDASTLTDAHPDLTEASHHIAVASGTEVTGYVDALNRDLAPLGVTARMVLTSVAVTGLVAGTVGVPLGVALHGRVVPAMGNSVGLRLPDSVIAVYDAADLLPLVLGGLLIATLGALLPAGWAARARTATAPRTEQRGPELVAKSLSLPESLISVSRTVAGTGVHNVDAGHSAQTGRARTGKRGSSAVHRAELALLHP